jgi:hypothetical protein
MGLLHLATLSIVGVFYGVFVGLILAGTFDPANVCGAYESGDPPSASNTIADCQAAFDLVIKKGANGPLVVHVVTMVMRLEGFLWAGLGLCALASSWLVHSPSASPRSRTRTTSGCSARRRGTRNSTPSTPRS